MSWKQLSCVRQAVAINLILQNVYFVKRKTGDGNKLLSSAENGRSSKRIKEASEIRQDVISRRLASIGSDVYHYHMSNDCYKRYTSKSLLDRIVRKRKAGETETESVTESLLNTPAIPVRKILVGQEDHRRTH